MHNALHVLNNIPATMPKGVTAAALVVAEEFAQYGEFNQIYALATNFGKLPHEILQMPISHAILSLRYANTEARYNAALYEK